MSSNRRRLESPTRAGSSPRHGQGRHRERRSSPDRAGRLRARLALVEHVKPLAGTVVPGRSPGLRPGRTNGGPDGRRPRGRDRAGRRVPHPRVTTPGSSATRGASCSMSPGSRTTPSLYCARSSKSVFRAPPRRWRPPRPAADRRALRARMSLTVGSSTASEARTAGIEGVLDLGDRRSLGLVAAVGGGCDERARSSRAGGLQLVGRLRLQRLHRRANASRYVTPPRRSAS